MQNKSLLWIIPSCENKLLLNEINLNQLKTLANNYNYNVKFIVLLDNSICRVDDEFKDFSKLNRNVDFEIKVYDKKVYINTSIMKELENAEYDNIMITNYKYTKNILVVEEMLERSLLPNINFVRVYKKHISFYGEITKLTKGLYNKVVKMFTSSQDKMFIRNCVIFDKTVLDLMKDFPNNSGIIRETSYLACTQTSIVEVDEKFKTSKFKPTTIWQIILSSLVCVLSISLLVVCCAIRMNIDLLLWLLILSVILMVGGLIFLNYSILKEKIKINDFYLDATKKIAPLSIYENKFNTHLIVKLFKKITKAKIKINNKIFKCVKLNFVKTSAKNTDKD